MMIFNEERLNGKSKTNVNEKYAMTRTYVREKRSHDQHTLLVEYSKHGELFHWRRIDQSDFDNGRGRGRISDWSLVNE